MSDNSNRPQDIPYFDIKKKGRIEADFFKMTHGYLIIDQDTGQKSAVRGEKDIEEIFLNIAEDVKEELKKMLETKSPDEFVSLTIILADTQKDLQPELKDIDGPAQVDISQLADIINDLISGEGRYGIPSTRRSRISSQDLLSALTSHNMVSIHTRVVGPKDEQHHEKSSNVNINRDTKKHYHDHKNKQQDHHNQNKDDDDKSESTKLD